MSPRRRERRGLISAVLVLALTGVVIARQGQRGQQGEPLTPALASALDGIRAESLMGHVTTLASDEFEGRGPGTPGETRTVNYLVEQFKLAGLKPGNPNGTYVQHVPLVGYTSIPEIQIEAAGRNTALTFLDEFVHDYPALRPVASAKQVGIVFAGYGIVAPEYGWNDYEGADVRQKLVIVLSGEPSRPGAGDPKTPDPAFFKGDTRTYYSTREFKFDLAAKKGAAGVLVVYDPDTARTYSLFQTFAKMEGFALASARASATVISGLMTTAAARRVASLAGRDFDQLAAGAARPRARAVALNATANISVKSTLRNVVSRNVVARVEGSDPRLKDEYVIYSAHWDSMGKDTTLAGDQIYNGAIDNAIGTAQLLEVARGFAALRGKPRRSILFIAVTAEEKGYLGSRFYARQPLFPIAKTIANINLDGGNVWGPTSDLISTGYGLSTLDEALGEAARLQGRTFANESLDNGGLYFASDQIEFAKAGIPAVFPFSGSTYVGQAKDFGDARWKGYAEKDYHKVTDEVKPDWNLSGAAEDARWFLITGYNVADSTTRPEWKRGSEFKR
jgi:Zn-dependent M28 family amino/carboxypeptidase